MTHPARAGSGFPACSLVFGIAVAVVASACMRESQQQGGSNACSPPGGEFDDASRQSIVAWAGGLNYHPHDATYAFVYGFAPGDSVRIQAAVLDTTGSGGSSPRRCIYARITSAQAFPALGIGAGVNYLWADSLAGGDRSVIIPADSTRPMTVHPLVLHSHALGAPPPAQVGMYGSCGQCKTYWCRAGLDSVGAASLMEPRELERLRTDVGVR